MTTHYTTLCAAEYIHMFIRHVCVMCVNRMHRDRDKIHKTNENGVINIPSEIDDQSNKF